MNASYVFTGRYMCKRYIYKKIQFEHEIEAFKDYASVQKIKGISNNICKQSKFVSARMPSIFITMFTMKTITGMFTLSFKKDITFTSEFKLYKDKIKRIKVIL